MITNIDVNLSCDQVDEIIQSGLKDQLKYDELMPEGVKDAIHKVIAWYSVPGTYEDGEYDYDFDE